MAAWIDARTTPAHVRVARRPAGGSWSASIDITPSPANVQSLALSVRTDGFVWAVWGDTRGTSQDIWGARYDPSLNTWSAAVRLDDDPGTTAAQSGPTVAFGPAETMLAWRDNRLNANGDTQARRVQVLAGMSDHFALSYDGLNRLKSVSGPVAESFTLDGASNITARTGPNQTDTYDTANRLTSDGSQSYTWSNADRLTNRAADTFGYDSLDRMTSSTVVGSARTYAYNGDGLLQSRTGAGATSFLWDPATSPSLELKQGNDNIIYGLGPLYVVKADATTVTIARDGSKNVRTEVSPTGLVTAAFRYRGYGQIAQASASAPTYLGLASQLVDPSGLVYMRARWYDPVSARLITRDPAPGDPRQPATLNAYAYAAANPVLMTDPSGLRSAIDDGGCSEDCASIDAKQAAAADGSISGQVLHDVMVQANGADCKGRENCGYVSNGVLIIQNAAGPVRALMDVYTLWQGDTLTMGEHLIISHGMVPEGDDLYRHEMGHVAQAKLLGIHYIATYAAEFVFEGLHHPGESYKYHVMEIDANRRAGLDDFWHVSH